MDDPYKFISTSELLAQIGEGIGRAHENLRRHSRPASEEVGMLAVKTAQVNVNFELTSNGSKNVKDVGLPDGLPFLGVKTFTFTETVDNKSIINRATIVLNIVNVIPSNPVPDT